MAQENRTLEPIKMGATGLNQLAKNLEDLESSIKSDDIAEQLAKNWKNIAWAVALVVVIGLGINALKEGQARSAGAASERFEAVQNDFETLAEKNNASANSELSTNTARAFQDNLKAIRDLDAHSIYASYGQLYEASQDLNSGNAIGALDKLKPFKISQLTGKLNSENLLLEQALLLKSKALLASADSKQLGIALLKELALESRIVAGEALISYLRVFGLDQQLIDSTLTKNPGLREILKSDLQSLGAIKVD